MSSSLSGQTALVTGGASGIGLAVARLLRDNGAQLAIADANADALKAVSKTLGAIAIDCNVADARSVRDAFDAAGKVDILVHSAGVGLEMPFLETSDDEWARLIAIDLTGSFYCLREAGRRMVEQGYGRIVALSSTAGIRGGTGRCAYGAAKAGVISLVQVLASELATSGVTVNALAPGAIETDLVARMHSAETRTNYRRSIPMDRYGTPEEVAAAALFLASPQSAYVTGHVLVVDGGFCAAGVLNKA